MLILFWKFFLPTRLIEPTRLFNFGNCSYLHVISNCALIKEVRVLMYLLNLCSLVRRPFLLKQLHQNRFDVRLYLNILVQYCLSTFSLQVVLKVSDIQVIMEHEHLLLNLHWILSKNTAPTTPVMNAIQFLTKICSQVPRSRAFLRDNLGLASTLTNLLVSLGVNSSSKSSKVLELLRFVSHGISIIRQESYLEKLIVQLLRLL